MSSLQHVFSTSYVFKTLGWCGRRATPGGCCSRPRKNNSQNQCLRAISVHRQCMETFEFLFLEFVPVRADIVDHCLYLRVRCEGCLHLCVYAYTHTNTHTHTRIRTYVCMSGNIRMYVRPNSTTHTKIYEEIASYFFERICYKIYDVITS